MSFTNANLDSLGETARRLSERLEQTRTRIVFAESCTGGLVAAALASIPGISRWLCGSAVTYQEQTKQDWLAVSEADLRNYSAVSPQVSLAMARAVLRNTSRADLSVAITGHLGPGAPEALDGRLFVAALWRGRTGEPPWTRRVELTSRLRVDRQCEAAHWGLQVSIECIEQKPN